MYGSKRNYDPAKSAHMRLPRPGDGWPGAGGAAQTGGGAGRTGPAPVHPGRPGAAQETDGRQGPALAGGRLRARDPCRLFPGPGGRTPLPVVDVRSCARPGDRLGGPDPGPGDPGAAGNHARSRSAGRCWWWAAAWGAARRPWTWPTPASRSTWPSPPCPSAAPWPSWTRPSPPWTAPSASWGRNWWRWPPIPTSSCSAMPVSAALRGRPGASRWKSPSSPAT